MRVITIGRGPGNDIVIQDPKVSKIHLQLVSNGNICSAVDLNSTNGTYVNGRKISGEVCLQPNDTIRIGDTMLPWQTYLNPATDSKTVVPSIDASSKHNRRNLWIALSVAIAIILGGAAFGIYYYNQSKEKNEALEKINRDNESRFKQEAEQNEEKRLNEKAEEEQYRQALREDRDNSKELAEKKALEAKEANIEKEKANEAAAAAKKDASAAKQRADEADRAKTQAQNAAKQAEQDKNKGIQDAQDKASKAISEANEKAKLTEQFYEEYSTMKQEFAKQVCNRLGKEITKEMGDAKTVLKGIFTQFDNKGKRTVIDAIMYVKLNPRGEKLNSEEKDTTVVISAPKDTSSAK